MCVANQLYLVVVVARNRVTHKESHSTFLFLISKYNFVFAFPIYILHFSKILLNFHTYISNKVFISQIFVEWANFFVVVVFFFILNEFEKILLGMEELLFLCCYFCFYFLLVFLDSCLQYLQLNTLHNSLSIKLTWYFSFPSFLCKYIYIYV